MYGINRKSLAIRDGDGHDDFHMVDIEDSAGEELEEHQKDYHETKIRLRKEVKRRRKMMKKGST